MSIEEHRRTMVLTRVVAGSLLIAEAALLLGLFERSVWRLKRRFLADGPKGLVHGNRERSAARLVGDAVRASFVELANGRAIHCGEELVSTYGINGQLAGDNQRRDP